MEDPAECIEQPVVWIRRSGVVEKNPKLDVRAEDRAEFREEIVHAEPGEDSRIESEDDLTWDDVRLFAAANDGCVDGIPEERPQVAGPTPEKSENVIGQARVEESS